MTGSLEQALNDLLSWNPILCLAGALVAGEILSRAAARLTRGSPVASRKPGPNCPHCVACGNKACARQSAAS
ncbi:MAG: hypothetical protein U1E62_07450 [Alsobacter sp.]